MSTKVVEEFRQIVFWPLQLMQRDLDHPEPELWTALDARPEQHAWRPVGDQFLRDAQTFSESHYIEFITFLPYVQRLLYGEGSDGFGAGPRRSPVRLYRRTDVTGVRLTFPDGEQLTLTVEHVDLYFFYDLDLCILAFEMSGRGLALARAQEILFRFGRAYPHFWKSPAQGSEQEAPYCLKKVEWLDAHGSVLAASDYEAREEFLSFVQEQRAPRISEHWQWLLRPLRLHYLGGDDGGREDGQGEAVLRFRQIEYHRMPLMAYLSMDDLSSLSRGDFVRLGLVTAPGDSNALPYSSQYLEDFERNYCYDRFKEGRGEPHTGTRIICCGHAFLVMGNQRDGFFTSQSIGLKAQFRNQFFIIGLIAHLHKAALLMLRDRLGAAAHRLDVRSVESTKAFSRSVRLALETFLRFTHRYWFREIAVQMQARDLFRLWRRHMGTVELYEEVREEVQDMSSFLSTEDFRRQADTVLRLTVVTVVGLVGSLATGFLGMNLFNHSELHPVLRGLIFLGTTLPTAALVLFIVAKSRGLAALLDRLANGKDVGLKPPRE